MEIVKRLIAMVLALFSQFQMFLSNMDVIPKDLGIPTQHSYTEEQRLSCSVWDMALCGDILYIGAGDYSANTGPTPIWAYDIKEEVWSVSATVEDESVNRFCRVGDALIAPGADATGTSWKFGNYHTLDQGKWTSFQKLPGAVHNFDVTHFADRYFFALGTADGAASPVLVSTDGQTDFLPVPFYKDDQLLLDSSFSHTRVYDFFSVGDSLYCLLYCYTNDGIAARAFCRYADGAFHWAKEAQLEFSSWKQIPVMGKASLGPVQYFTTGTLYKTEDFSDITPVEMPNGGVVTDLYTDRLGEQQLLYALSNTKNEDGTYTATIYLVGQTVTAVADYTATAPALSFVRRGIHFYIGLGGSETLRDTGKVIRLSTFAWLFAS